jgi:hypothetical protein
VRDQDVRNLTVSAMPPAKIDGEVVWDGDVSGVLQSEGLPVLIDVLQGRGRGSRTSLPTIPAVFSTTAFAHEPHNVALFRLPPPYYVKDISYNGASTLYQPFIPGSTGGRLRVVIGRDGGVIETRVNDDRGLPAAYKAVMIFPADTQSDSELASLLVAGLTDSEGIYRGSGLRPGRYTVLATGEPPPYRVSMEGLLLIDPTPEALAQLMQARSLGQIVNVSSGATVPVTLTPRPLK